MFLFEVWQVTVRGHKADWTKPAHHTSTALAEKLAWEVYTAEMFGATFDVSGQILLANSVNIQPIWNAWDIGQMITHTLKLKQEKTPFCRRFNGTIKIEEEKGKELWGREKSIGIWTKKIDINVCGRKWKNAPGLYSQLPTNTPANQTRSREKFLLGIELKVCVCPQSVFVDASWEDDQLWPPAATGP